MNILNIITSIAPSLICGILMAMFNSRMKKRENEIDKRALARKKESLLALAVQMATAKLAFAVAVCQERGNTNGELKEAKEAYHKAKEAYVDFLNEQAKEHILDL